MFCAPVHACFNLWLVWQCACTCQEEMSRPLMHDCTISRLCQPSVSKTHQEFSRGCLSPLQVYVECVLKLVHEVCRWSFHPLAVLLCWFLLRLKTQDHLSLVGLGESVCVLAGMKVTTVYVWPLGLSHSLLLPECPRAHCS